MNRFNVLQRPVITEKSSFLKEAHNKIVFHVDKKTNKIEIEKAVEDLFKVKVRDVNTHTIKGKPKRVGRHLGRRSDVKKAIVTLEPGYKIEFFEGM
ncbi:MAG: 50S ribosomal protein L23 [Deltaproteobacteria bacterium]